MAVTKMKEVNPVNAAEQASPVNEEADKRKLTKEEKRLLKQQKKWDKKAHGKGGRGKIIALMIVALIIAALVAVVGFDALGLRSRYLNGFLQNIPIVKNVIPAEDNIDGAYAGLSREQLVDEIDRLNAAVDQNRQEVESLTAKSDMYVKEIARLKAFEEQQVAYKADKEAFDAVIAMGNPAAYAQYYATISPENAEVLYQQAVRQNQNTKEIKNYVATFTAMDESEAASILSEMIATDMDLVVLIVSHIDSESRGAIMGQMTPADAASVAKMMAPKEEQQVVAAPPAQ